MTVDFSRLKFDISSRYLEMKSCGANRPGGGGFQAGNTCGKSGKSGFSEGEYEGKTPLDVANRFYNKMFGSDLPEGWSVRFY